jgi:N-acetylglutamate synthase-like GNAT family acetyltransferase
MNIEKASVEDAEEILALQKRAFLQEAELYGDLNIEPMTMTAAQNLAEFKDALILKMTENGRIIGSVRANVKDKTCLVRKLMVEPGLQNRGYGLALMRAVEKECGDCIKFELYTGYKSENNKHLYMKLGYGILETIMLNDKVGMVRMVKEKAINN